MARRLGRLARQPVEQHEGHHGHAEPAAQQLPSRGPAAEAAPLPPRAAAEPTELAESSSPNRGSRSTRVSFAEQTFAEDLLASAPEPAGSADQKEEKEEEEEEEEGEDLLEEEPLTIAQAALRLKYVLRLQVCFLLPLR